MTLDGAQLEAIARRWHEAIQPLLQAAQRAAEAFGAWARALPPEMLEALAPPASGVEGTAALAAESGAFDSATARAATQ